MADQFFTRFAEQVQALVPQPASSVATRAEPATQSSAAKSGKAVWVLLAIGVALAVTAWFLTG
jgi:type VI protein secretion system component VasF